MIGVKEHPCLRHTGRFLLGIIPQAFQAEDLFAFVAQRAHAVAGGTDGDHFSQNFMAVRVGIVDATQAYLLDEAS